MTSISPGDIVLDREQPNPDEAVVVNTPPVKARDWYVQGRGMVADDNPDYPADNRVAIVVYRPTLNRRRPNYAGYGHLELSVLNEGDLSYYAYPESRLERVGELGETTIPLTDIRPAPYHARSFSADRNRQFIESIQARGYPRPYPTLRVVDDGYEIVNGHKRVWASAAAGVDTIRAHCIHIDDWEAAQRFVEHHLNGSYSQLQAGCSLNRLRERWGNRVSQLPVAAMYTNQQDQEVESPA